MKDLFKEENDTVRELGCTLDDALEFQLSHDVQIIRGEDFQYLCYIDRKGYSPSLTPMHALFTGILIYKKLNSVCQT